MSVTTRRLLEGRSGRDQYGLDNDSTLSEEMMLQIEARRLFAFEYKERWLSSFEGLSKKDTFEALQALSKSPPYALKTINRFYAESRKENSFSDFMVKLLEYFGFDSYLLIQDPFTDVEVIKEKYLLKAEENLKIHISKEEHD